MNVRALEMWQHISKAISFAGKSVIDLGCGYGDLLSYAKGAGAWHYIGIDKDVSQATPGIPVVNRDIAYWCKTTDEKYDVGICTSVLPYIEERHVVLSWLASHCKEVIIEVQLYGDGPGLPEHTSTLAVLVWLKKYFDSVQGIGYTTPEGRSHRALWHCKGVSHGSDIA